jgi:hypothetical protein
VRCAAPSGRKRVWQSRPAYLGDRPTGTGFVAGSAREEAAMALSRGKKGL